MVKKRNIDSLEVGKRYKDEGGDEIEIIYKFPDNPCLRWPYVGVDCAGNADGSLVASYNAKGECADDTLGGDLIEEIRPKIGRWVCVYRLPKGGYTIGWALHDKQKDAEEEGRDLRTAKFVRALKIEIASDLLNKEASLKDLISYF